MRAFITGGAGFIGSHLVDQLASRGPVTVFDNLSVGRAEWLAGHIKEGRVTLVQGDALDADALTRAMEGHDLVVHLVANPEVFSGLSRTRLDLEQGTLTTYNALESARTVGVRRFLFASSGTVYGDTPEPCAEGDLGRLPVSLYGASKLASEGLVSAYAECFEIGGTIVRFGNVVGPRAAHGVIVDFCKKLRASPERLEVLGDGNQAKPFLHVSDCVAGLMHLLGRPGGTLDVFNLAPGDVTRVSTLAELCVAASPNPGARIEYAGGRRGWRGDIPTSRLVSEKIGALGFRLRHTSNEAARRAVQEVAREVFAP